MFQFDDMNGIQPDDLAALMEIAGPLYRDSRAMESLIADNPVAGEHSQSGSMSIRKGLEEAERLLQARMRQQQPPPQPTHYYQPPIQTPVQQTPVQQPPQEIYYSPPVVQTPTVQPQDNFQLEFTFDKKGLDSTNDLLKEISVKLSKILTRLEKVSIVPTDDNKPKGK